MTVTIYITGDIHGDLSRFNTKGMRRLRKGDTLIICGDFGFLWEDSKAEQKALRWIGKRRYNVLFVEGTHDNLDLIEKYPVTDWMGGKVREISGNLRQLVRGSVFTLENSKLLAFGGGDSVDADMRHAGETWWSRELPTPEEVEIARQNLALHENKVDYIITHQPSNKIHGALTMKDNEPNNLDVFLDEVLRNCSFTRWYFGHYHLDRLIPPNQVAVFKEILPVTRK
ncbi:metallophosphoesterase [Oscillospiraceae bacterium MB08-C2-2]|nr:metallophosphoesterase [Oscillospiraceae bacterium MB08-C2-2]